MAKKRKPKYKVQNIVIAIFLFALILFLVIYLFTHEIKQRNNPENPSLKDPEKPQQTPDDPVAILKKEFLDCTYYVASNLDRYMEYIEKNPDLSKEEVVKRVNAWIDYEPYTNDVASRLSDGKLILVNKYHYLEEDYVPELVLMDTRYSYENWYADKEAYEHLILMVEAARLDGIKIYNISSYRSYSLQNRLYTNYLKEDPNADTYSARPGYSEHQTGLAFDLNFIDDAFANTKEGIWLAKNAHLYGFILRYPEGKEYITGYKYEPWHYRYVGIEVAKYINEHQITYEEYYAKFVQ